MVDRGKSKQRPTASEARESLVHYLSTIDHRVHLVGVHVDGRTIRAKMSVNGVNYMDANMRDWCMCCAEDLRTLLGRNVFFDIHKGRFTLFMG